MTVHQEAISRIDQLAAGVRLVPMRADEVKRLNPPFDGVSAWTADYAVLIVIPMEQSKINDSWGAVQSWFDDVLLMREQEMGRVVDGYVVFLADGPSDAPSPLPLELSRTVCRKYVVWPDTSDDPWMGLSRVSVLGLPTTGTVLDNTVLPVPSPELEQLWRSVVDADKDTEAIDAACELDP